MRFSARLLAVLACALALAAGPALAQVAAPTILPAAPGVQDPAVLRGPSLVPLNPAALSWATPAKIGLGTLRTTRDLSASSVAGTPVPAQSFDYVGSYGGFQVGQRYALAVDAIQVQDQSKSEKLIASDSAAALSVQFANAVAVGAGYRSQHEETAAEKSDSHSASAGLSLRLGEYFFLGGAYGTDSIVRTATAAAGVPLRGQRGDMVWGVGFRKGGALRMHLEYDAAHLDNYEYKGLKTLGGSVNSGVAEFGFWYLLLGYTGTSVDLSADRITSKGNEVTLGFAGDHGLAVLFHYNRAQTQVAATGLDVDAVTRAVSLAWQF
jgi:hypothetical protein